MRRSIPRYGLVLEHLPAFDRLPIHPPDPRPDRPWRPPGDAAHADDGSLGDVACFGRPTLLLVRVRRFRCTAPACPRRTFAEPLPGVAQTRARQTDRLRAVHRTIGLALGGNPGARHAAAMGVPISRTTLLTRVRTGDAVPGPAVSVLCCATIKTMSVASIKPH